MKIGLMVHDTAIGGIMTFVLNLAPLLAQAGHEVTIIALA